MDSRRSGNGSTGCGDDEALQRLVDGELQGCAEELWLHHVATCPSCASRVAELRELRAWCAARLGTEDEAAEWRRDAAVTRVRARIDQMVCRPAKRPAWRWLAAATAAAFVFLAIVMPPNPRPVGASAERVLRETILRERAWMDQPGKVVRWTIEETLTNNPRNADGHYHSVSWKYNIGPGKTATLKKRFDTSGTLVWARSDSDDGSEVAYDAKTGTATVRPSFEELRREAAAFDAERREMVDSWVAYTARTSETANYVDLFAGAPSRSTPVIDFVRRPDVGDVYRLRWRFGTAGSTSQPAGTIEACVARDGFRMLCHYSTRTLPDGRVQRELAEWTDYRIVPVEEFRAETLDGIVTSAAHVIRRTAEDVVRWERGRQAALAAKR